MADVKSNGARVLGAWESWIASWIAFPTMPGDQALVLALWAMHTWFSAGWTATAYLFVTSEGPGCGKSTLQEVLAALSLRPRIRATMRTMAVVRDIAEHNGAITYFFDQVEALGAGKMGDDQAVLLTGYRRAGEHGISVGQRQVSFKTYCAKCFACCGSIAKDLESRCLVCLLGYGVPMRDWTDAAMTRDGEAAQMLDALGKVLPSESSVAWVPASFLEGRDKETASPLWSVACALGLDDATLERVKVALVNMSKWKAEAMTGRSNYRDMIADRVDDGAVRRGWEVKALRDLASVLPIASATVSGHVGSVRAVELMMVASREWARFGGMGLDAVGLSALLLPFGLKAEPVRLTKGAGRQVRGYRADKVMAALAKLGKG